MLSLGCGLSSFPADVFENANIPKGHEQHSVHCELTALYTGPYTEGFLLMRRETSDTQEGGVRVLTK